jgi:hypothetical protein
VEGGRTDRNFGVVMILLVCQHSLFSLCVSTRCSRCLSALAVIIYRSAILSPIFFIFTQVCHQMLIPVAERSNARIYGRSLAGIDVSSPAEFYMFASVVCRQVEISATGRSLVQRNPTDCCVRQPWTALDC